MSIEALSGIRGIDEKGGSVMGAIRHAAQQTGMDFDLMLGVAKRESSLRADAKADTSSASGLFQFIDQTWLGAVKEHGDELGLSEFAKDIQRGEKGFTVADPARREEILNLRFKPAVAAKVAGKTLAMAKDRLSEALGREASGSEVYMAHFLGERGAVRMLQAGEEAVAAAVDPRAANANQPLFYEGGRPLSVAEFKGKIALHIGLDDAPGLGTIPDVRVPLKPVGPVPSPHRAPATEKAPQPKTLTEAVQGLPPQLYAAIVEMQSDFILGKKG